MSEVQDRYLLARIQSVQADNPGIRCTVELVGFRNPALPLRPGESADFELRVVPEGAGSRYYGYVMVDSFESFATMEKAAGMSLLAVGDRYATSTVAGEERVAKFTLKISDNPSREAFFVPQLRAGIIANGGSSLTASTRTLKQNGYRVGSFPAQGRKLIVPPGYRGAVKGLTDGLGDRAKLVGVGPARRGETSVAPDGVVTYNPFQGYIGYDWFDYVIDDGEGRLVRARVTVFVGDTAGTPGIIQ